MLDQGCSSPGSCFWSICIVFVLLANLEVSRLWFQGIVGEYEFLSLKDSGTHRDRMRRFSTVCKEIALWLSKNWFVLLPQSWAVLNPRPSQDSSFSSYHQQQAGLEKGGDLAGGLGLLTRNAALCPFVRPPTPVLLCTPESYRLLLWKTHRRIRIPMLTCGQWSPVPRKYVLEPLQATKCFFTLVGLASVRSRVLS